MRRMQHGIKSEHEKTLCFAPSAERLFRLAQKLNASERSRHPNQPFSLFPTRYLFFPLETGKPDGKRTIDWVTRLDRHTHTIPSRPPPATGASTASGVERALRHIQTWKRHCSSLRSMHESGSGTSPTLSLQRACGVCGVYGLETLYASHAASVGNTDVQLEAGALMEFIKWGLVERGAGGSKIDPAFEVAGAEALLELASSTFYKADAYEKALIKVGALAMDDQWRRVRGLYFSVRAELVLCLCRDSAFSGLGSHR